MRYSLFIAKKSFILAIVNSKKIIATHNSSINLY